jgi:hypothetical protein
MAAYLVERWAVEKAIGCAELPARIGPESVDQISGPGQNCLMQPLPKLPKLARKPRQIDERCGICGCRLHRTGSYALPTPEGRSHATEHHYVAERFFGRSTNRKNEQRDRIFEHCPWGLERQSGVFCYECHEELLHNPVLTKADIERFAALVQRRGLNEEEKSASRAKLAGRIQLLQAVIAAGLKSLEVQP